MRSRAWNAAIALTLVLLATPIAARADVVLDWNAIAVRTVLTPPAQNPFFQARFLAITQLAVFEAVNAIRGGYEPYLGTIDAPAGASAEAAAIAAAHRVLITYFATNATAVAALNADLAASLAAIPDGPAKTAGRAVGEAAADAMIALRANDGSAPQPLYIPPSTQAGEWQPTPTPPPPAPQCTGGQFTQWPTMTPFGIPGPEQFILKPPPDLTSNQYLKDYNEVKRVGSATASLVDRPQDRADVARFYVAASPTLVFNSAARQLAAARGDSLSENARNLALVNMAISDSFIVSFATKYTYNLWRPVTAIRAGDSDGNDYTVGDPSWSPFITTPCFPAYPSNHASGTGSGAEALRRIYGNHNHSLDITNPVLGMTLHYTRLSDIVNDVDDARVYGGIHWRFDQDGGNVVGRTIGAWVVKHNLREARN